MTNQRAGRAILTMALLALGGCSFVELPERLDMLERDQAQLGESVDTLTSRYASLETETRELAERQDKVEAWIRRLGNPPARQGPSPTGRPAAAAAAPAPAVDARRLLRGGVESVLFDNRTDRIVTIRTARGPSFVKGGALDLRVVPAGESDGDPARAPGVYRVPCGGRLVANATVDMLLFVEAENGEPCRSGRFQG